MQIRFSYSIDLAPCFLWKSDDCIKMYFQQKKITIKTELLMNLNVFVAYMLCACKHRHTCAHTARNNNNNAYVLTELISYLVEAQIGYAYEFIIPLLNNERMGHEASSTMHGPWNAKHGFTSLVKMMPCYLYMNNSYFLSVGDVCTVYSTLIRAFVINALRSREYNNG